MKIWSKMKLITRAILVLFAVCIFYSCEELEREVYSNEDGRYVRFALQVDKNGEVVSSGSYDPAAELVRSYDQSSIKPLKIPVTITSEPLEEEVIVTFSTSTTGNFTGFEINPENTLSFNGTQLTDTIYLNYLESWDASEENLIHFKLETVSDTSIQIGNISALEKNDSLTVDLRELYLRYNLPAVNSIDILGVKGEQVEISVFFPDGLFVKDLDTLTLLIPTVSQFDYTLERLPFDQNSDRIDFILTLNEDIDNDVLAYRTVFSLYELEGYIIAGNTGFSITKPIFIERDNAVNTAANFYNTDDALYRTYGETWMDYNNDDICAWQSYNTFTYPVEVSADHPNAVLADDKGTPDPGDDIYHHAFRIGFNSPNAGRTTNSFNLKRWFVDYYSDADYSPGFNIPQALEFFPDDGTSTTGGVVRVITQDITISNRVSRDPDVFHTYTISIDGEGEYIEISDGIFEISLEFKATNTDLFGGTRTVYYKIYNTDEYVDPPDRTDGCFSQINL